MERGLNAFLLVLYGYFVVAYYTNSFKVCSIVPGAGPEDSKVNIPAL